MKPREVIAQTTSCSSSPLLLVKHDGRLFLENDGSQVDASHLGHSARETIGMMCRPFRPARQPRMVFLGLGFGHAVEAARQALPQEKSSFVILPESSELPTLLSSHLESDPLDDSRVLIDNLSPFALLGADYDGTQGIFLDHDQLASLAPGNWSITSPCVLANYHERLKVGGLLGVLSNRPVQGLEKELRKNGFDIATDLIPFSEKSKKNRTLYLARKGHYQRSH